MRGVESLVPERAAFIEAAVAASVRAVAESLPGWHQDATPAATAVDWEDVKRTRRGDSDAYRRLIERHQDRVARMLWRFSRDRRVHEELVQDVFVEAYLSLRGYNGKAPLAHWLARIATRVGYRYWKEKARRKGTEAFDLQEWDEAVDAGLTTGAWEPDHAGELLHRLLEQMTPRGTGKRKSSVWRAAPRRSEHRAWM